ncbi:unnamed protein product, partial [Adineta steineri]
FALHTAENDLFSMNYMHEGSSKFWYFIPSSYANQLEQCLQHADILNTSHCQASLRHKDLFLNPNELFQLHKIPVYKTEQHPNEIIVTFPRVYHWGFSGGFNVTESVNFALPSWVPFGQLTSSCTCQERDSFVKIDMKPFHELNIQNYIDTHLNNLFLQLDNNLLTPSTEQSMIDSGINLSLEQIATTITTNLFSQEFDAFISGNLFDFYSASDTYLTHPSSCTANIQQSLPSSLRTSSMSSEELLLVGCSTTPPESNNLIEGEDEIAANTACIRRKWIEDKDTLISQLIADVNKPQISSIHQWELLINSDDIDLNDYLPENIRHSVDHRKKTIESFADWTVAFTYFSKAIIYLFKHRESELDAHFERISNLYREESPPIKLMLAYEADIRHHVAIMPHLRLIVDHLCHIYVVDCCSHRVMHWCEGEKEGEILVSGNVQGNQSDQLYYPTGLSFDNEENLYVVDHNNHPVRKYEKL